MLTILPQVNNGKALQNRGGFSLIKLDDKMKEILQNKFPVAKPYIC